MNLIVFSHLRWGFVYQRPQHLISRFARRDRVWFFEEPFFGHENASLEKQPRDGNLTVCRPLLPDGLSEEEIWAMQRSLLDQLIVEENIDRLTAWYYTPM